jgi:hypothetical protein
VLKEEGYKEIRARLGTPPPDELPPGLEDLKKRLAREKAEAAEAALAAEKAAALAAEEAARSDEPVEEEGLKGKLGGLFEKVGCSIAIVG